MRHVLSAILLGAMTCGLSVPVGATEFCEIPKTRDGFVALRSGPSTGSAIVARMRVGDEVMADAEAAPRNGWVRVSWWKGGRFRPEGYAFDKPSGKGWMSRAFMRDCG